jgi:outer membrane murein-binding lipoprotein Lpp
MRIHPALVVLVSTALAAGCSTAKIDELTKQVDQLREENGRLTKELQAVQAERDALRHKVAQADEIRKGYEEARRKFQEQLSGLSSVFGGGAFNPLPPFEGLRSSEWVGKLMPGATADLKNLKELKEVESELIRGILGSQPKKP